MGKNFIIEIGTEDLPSWCGKFFETNFLPVFQEKLNEERIVYENVEIFYTPRRILIFGKNFEEKQKDKVIEIYGPPVEIAIDKDNKYTVAAEKFAESNKVKLKDLKILERKGKKVIGIIKREKGKSIKKILNEILNKCINQLEIPKGMIWKEKDLKFSRPIRWICALYGDEILPVEIGSIKGKRFTIGHRVLSNRKIEVFDTQDYFDKLLKNFVIFDQKIRKNMIEAQIKKIFENEKILYDEKLIESIVPLVEYPVCGLCNLPEKFNKLPYEVVSSIIQKVKGIPVFSEDGSLLPKFIIVSDGIFNENVKENYQKVVESKIEDAVFFINQDISKKKFIDCLEDLKNIVYHPKFGTIYDRVERIRKIAGFICENLNLSEEKLQKINLIISLFKNDLATLMVSEFPSLQGIIGRIYAEKEGYDEIVSKSIEEHYLPKFSGDKTPTFLEGAVVSIADRIETICSFLTEEIEIKGEKDPYGLKRITNGLIEIIWNKEIEISIKNLIKKTLEILNRYNEETEKRVFDFVIQRLDNFLTSQGIEVEVKRAFLSIENENIPEIKRRIYAYQQVIKEENGYEFLIPFIRVMNMLKLAEKKKIQTGEFNENLLQQDEEKELYKFYKENQERMRNLYNEKKYVEFLKEMKKWKQPIDKFFEKVFVMVEDEKIRNNRLALLKKIGDLFICFGNFSYISIPEAKDA